MNQTQLDLETDASEPIPIELHDRMPEWMKIRRIWVAVTFLFAAFFWRASFRPLWPTELWGQLSYGTWIWNLGYIPSTEPLMPLAAGVRWINTEWLSQLIFFGLHRAAGFAGLQFLFAFLLIAGMVLFFRTAYRTTNRIAPSLLGLGFLLWMSWEQLFVGFLLPQAILRPQLFGWVLFLAVLERTISRRPSPIDWVLIPSLFVLWANLHASFPIGIGLLLATGLGRLIDSGIRKGQVASNGGWEWILIGELAFVAGLLNPYGIALHAEITRTWSNPNLKEVLEWGPLTISMNQGLAMACGALLLASLYKLSRRRVTASELLPVIGLGFCTLYISRTILWWAGPAALSASLHLREIIGNRATKNRKIPENPRSLWAVVSIMLVWIAFAGSPLGSKILRGKDPSIKMALSNATPIEAVGFLNRKPPVGLVYSPSEWGDYLIHAGPEGIQLMVSSQTHLIPEEVWKTHQQISQVHVGWEDLLDRYGINALVLERSQQGLIGTARNSDKWEEVYSDGAAVILYRKVPVR